MQVDPWLHRDLGGYLKHRQAAGVLDDGNALIIARAERSPQLDFLALRGGRWRCRPYYSGDAPCR